MTTFKRVTHPKSSDHETMHSDSDEHPAKQSTVQLRDSLSNHPGGASESHSKKKRGTPDDGDITPLQTPIKKQAPSKRVKAQSAGEVRETPIRSSRRGRTSGKESQGAVLRIDPATPAPSSVSTADEDEVDRTVDTAAIDAHRADSQGGNLAKQASEVDGRGEIEEIDNAMPLDPADDNGYTYDAASDPAVPSTFVDDRLHKLGVYRGLPLVSDKCQVVQPYPPHDVDDVGYLNYSSVIENLSRGAQEQLLTGLRFRRYKWAINLARASLDESTVGEDDKLRDNVNSGNNILGIVLGVVTRCELVADGLTEGKKAQDVHQISIIPFGFESFREQAYFSRKFNCSLYGPYGAFGVNYRTMVRAKPDSKGPRSPTTSRFKTFKAPMNLPRFMGAASFDASAPIYDGRHDGEHPFMFSESDFDRIRSWPLLKDADGDVVDLPEDSLVMLGYTVNRYSSTTVTGGWNLSLNIQFAFALNIPET